MLAQLGEKEPKLGEGVFIAPGATVVGDVQLGDGTSIWYGSVVRGDVGLIRVGARTNIQDLTIVHVTTDRFDTHIGADVTVGHRAILHGCTIEDHVLVGMGVIVMDGARVGSYSIVGAGALVTPGTTIPAGSLAVGSPARVVRPISAAERAQIDWSAGHYIDIARMHVESGVASGRSGP